MTRKKNSLPIELAPNLKKGLIALILVTIGILIILSFLGLAGQFGEYADDILAKGIGQLRYVLPFILFFIAYKSDPIHMRDDETDEPSYHPTHLIGSALLAIALAGLLHIIIARENSIEFARQGMGGGFAGHILSSYAINFFGVTATSVIFGSILVASLIFMFGTSLFALIMPHKDPKNPLHKWLTQERDVQRKQEKDNEPKYETIETEEKSTFMRRLLSLGRTNNEYEEDEDEEETEEDLQPEDISQTETNDMDSDNNTSEEQPAHKPRKLYRLPPLTLLKRSTATAKAGDIKNNMHIIEKTFANFGIHVEMSDTCVGPTVTQFTMRPADGVKLNKITGLSNDLALALAAHPIRIEAPIPGKSLVGIEVPNQKTATVTLLDLLENDEFTPIKSNYHIALGKDVGGKPIYTHLPSMPHMLVAGATGSGKTVCINTIILSLIFQHSPEELRLILVDPKRVELPLYNGIPHLLTPVITDTQKTINALRWCIGEMERRFDLLAKTKKRDINSYNETMRRRDAEILPVIVFVIDELADLMVAAGNEVEGGIIRLAQMARAVGIHLILATQRPSVDVITGLLKANIPGRIAFSVSSIIDSRTILDSAGAEKLVGKGDMLFSNASLASPKRIQGAFVSEDEMKRVIDFIKHDDAPVYDDAITQRKQTSLFTAQDDGADDELYHEARELVVSAGKASASYLQRRLKVGYARAARLLDILEENGIIGPAQGAKPREILITDNESARIKHDADEDAHMTNEDDAEEKDDDEYTYLS